MAGPVSEFSVARHNRVTFICLIASRSRMKHTAIFITVILLADAGCSQSPPSDKQSDHELLDRLKITEWDMSSYVGKSVTVQGENPDDGSMTIAVVAETRLVTQVSGVNRAIIVYVIDSTGVGSTVIQTGKNTDGLRLGELSGRTLYRFNDSRVVTLETSAK